MKKNKLVSGLLISSFILGVGITPIVNVQTFAMEGESVNESTVVEHTKEDVTQENEHEISENGRF